MTVGVLILCAGGAWILLTLVPRDKDPCLSGDRRPTQMNEQNPYFFSCSDAVYLPTSDARAPYKRVGALRAKDVEVLPFKYLRKADQLYYVALDSVGWEETNYALDIIKGVDVSTLEILGEGRIRDKDSVYTVMNDYVIVEPRMIM